MVISNEGLQKHQYGEYKEGQRMAKDDMDGGGKKRLDGLECP
jgi:hypothetical protein